MNYLLDTHVFLWWLNDDEKLSEKALKIIKNNENLVYISAASAWEIAIKTSIGKLKANFDFSEQLKLNSFQELPILSKHCKQLVNMPFHHHDPFDRLIISQAKTEKLKILTHNKEFKAYEVDLIEV